MKHKNAIGRVQTKKEDIIAKLKSKRISKEDLRLIKGEFDQFCHKLPIVDKRRFTKALSEEIVSTPKKANKAGEIVFKIRVDGLIKVLWEQIVNQKLPVPQLREL